MGEGGQGGKGGRGEGWWVLCFVNGDNIKADKKIPLFFSCYNKIGLDRKFFEVE